MALIALGVSGGIGAYKAVEVARSLQKHGHDVVAIMTKGAQQFVGPLTFEAITRRPVIADQWQPGLNAEIEHIKLTEQASMLLVVPATANLIAKFAHGLADDFLASFHLAARMPVLLAPAMNTNMLEHPAVQANLAALAARGVRFVEPGSGYLACGWIGKGRLAEPDDIVAAVERMLADGGAVAVAGGVPQPETGSILSLRGRRVLVTAGPTYEDIDPVRYIGNRSSGRMGLAVAEEAGRRGADVHVVLGPSSLTAPSGVEIERVRTAAEMYAAVMRQAERADAVVMSAAVADYTPADGAQAQKVSKADGGLTLRLTRTRDILADLGAARNGGRRPVLVGFAAETDDVVARARRKLQVKHVDLIVANDVSRGDAGFEVETNIATLIDASGEHALPLQSKRDLAARILDRVETLLADTHGS